MRDSYSLRTESHPESHRYIPLLVHVVMRPSRIARPASPIPSPDYPRVAMAVSLTHACKAGEAALSNRVAFGRNG